MSQGKRWDEGQLPLDGEQQEGDRWRSNNSGRIPPGSAKVDETRYGQSSSAQPGIREDNWRQKDELPVRDTDYPYGNGDALPHSQDGPHHQGNMQSHESDGLDAISHKENDVLEGGSEGTSRVGRLQSQGSPAGDDTVRQDDNGTRPGVTLRWRDDVKETQDDRSNQGQSNNGSRLDNQV